MKVIIEKEEKLETVLAAISSSVLDGKYFYLPGWFEKQENGEYRFHHLEKLPEDLLNTIQIVRNGEQSLNEEQKQTETEA